MAVVLITTIKEFIGLSSDAKPTGVPVGSTFVESDRGTTYITYDGTNWILFGISQYSY
jgi:hypothetical protein